MLLSVLTLFREKLPCSESFWLYKRNYELHMSANKEGGEGKTSPVTTTKILASPKLKNVRPLSPYTQMRTLGKYVRNEGGDSPKLGDMDEKIVMNSVPLAQFNHN